MMSTAAILAMIDARAAIDPEFAEHVAERRDAPIAAALSVGRTKLVPTEIGAFPIQSYDANHRVTIDLPGVLRGLSGAQFFVENRCGQATTYSASPLTVKVVPYTFAPAA